MGQSVSWLTETTAIKVSDVRQREVSVSQGANFRGSVSGRSFHPGRAGMIASAPLLA